jgi:hypothetical protein
MKPAMALWSLERQIEWQGENQMIRFHRSRSGKNAISLRTMSAVAIAFFIAGAVLPSGILHFVVPALHAAMPTGDGSEAAFIKENDIAMNKMMADMTIKPAGDVNRDFVDMMIPHHQGAIDMAKALLTHGDNEALRRIAQEIVITQQQEIVAMRLAIGEPAQPAASSGAATSTTGNMSGMQMSHDSMKMR